MKFSIKNQKEQKANLNFAGKSIKVLLLVVAVTFSSVLMASTEPIKIVDADATAITNEVYESLENSKLILEKEELVNVTLTLNKNNELVVLSVDSENEEIVSFIKNKLNYNKLSVNIYNKGKNYIVPVRLTIK